MTKTARSTPTTTNSELADAATSDQPSAMPEAREDVPTASPSDILVADVPGGNYSAGQVFDVNPRPATIEERVQMLEQRLFELSLSHGGQIAEHEQFIFELKAKQAAGFPVRIYIDAVCQHCGVRLNSPGITGAPTDVYQHPWEPSVKLNGAQCPHKGKRFKLAELFLTEAPPDARRNR